MPLTFLFWNLCRKPLGPVLRELATQHNVDVLILAECEMRPLDLLQSVNTGNQRCFFMPHDFNPRVRMLIRLPPDCLKPIQDSGGISIRHLVPPLGPSILIVGMHLTSQLYRDAEELSLLLCRAPQLIDEAEQAVGHDRTILVGDLNLNPYDAGVVGSEGLHGVMTRSIAQREHRVVQGKQRRFFYNPMWARLGEHPSRPAGTYHLDRSGAPVNVFWHAFDQVLVRPSLLGLFDDADLQVLSTAGPTRLLRDGIPDAAEFSDHLPILFSLQVEKGVFQ